MDHTCSSWENVLQTLAIIIAAISMGIALAAIDDAWRNKRK